MSATTNASARARIRSTASWSCSQAPSVSRSAYSRQRALLCQYVAHGAEYLRGYTARCCSTVRAGQVCGVYTAQWVSGSYGGTTSVWSISLRARENLRALRPENDLAE